MNDVNISISIDSNISSVTVSPITIEFGQPVAKETPCKKPDRPPLPPKPQPETIREALF